jgi:hypothetical protein
LTLQPCVTPITLQTRIHCNYRVNVKKGQNALPRVLTTLTVPHGGSFHWFHGHFVSHSQLLVVVRPVIFRPGFLLIPYLTYDMDAGDRTSEMLFSVARG